MEQVSQELILLVIVVALVVFAGVGIFMSTRISGGKKRIRDLEGELENARKDLEVYRSEVNDHFKKTSDLFSTMTESYKAVYMHLAEGAQDLCTSDAALLKGPDSVFIEVTPEEGAADEVTPEPDISGEEQAVGEAEIISDQVDQIDQIDQPDQDEQEPDVLAGQEEETESPEAPEFNDVDEDLVEPVAEDGVTAEDSAEKKEESSAESAVNRQN